MKIRDGELVIGLSELINDETRVELCKQACFDELLAEFVCKMLVEGDCCWDDDTARGIYQPWSLYRTGAPQAFEKARQEVAKLADAITQKLVSDLTKQRDELIAKCDALQSKTFDLDQSVRDLALENRRLRRELESLRCAKIGHHGGVE